jgi:hypothetical protein
MPSGRASAEIYGVWKPIRPVPFLKKLVRDSRAFFYSKARVALQV